MKSKANERQVGGAHYSAQTYQHWDYVLRTGLPYMEAQIVKYLSRWRTKNGVEDLRKAQHFLEKLIEGHTPEETLTYAGEFVNAKETTDYILRNALPQREAQVVALVAMAENLEELKSALVLLKGLVVSAQEEQLSADMVLGSAGRGYVDQDRGGSS